MKRTRIKFCGMTDAQDVALACGLGVDALGFIFVPASKRALDIEKARTLVAATPALVQRVGLFLDPSSEFVREVLARVALDCLQFHGDEDAAFCEGFGLPYLKAVAMGSDTDANALMTAHPNARGFVFDAHARGASGGGGVTFDWARVPQGACARGLILAGGLSPDNVFEAITRVRPWAVDVVTGIEAVKGRKDADKVRRFLTEARRADDCTD